MIHTVHSNQKLLCHNPFHMHAPYLHAAFYRFGKTDPYCALHDYDSPMLHFACWTAIGIHTTHSCLQLQYQLVSPMLQFFDDPPFIHKLPSAHPMPQVVDCCSAVEAKSIISSSPVADISRDWVPLDRLVVVVILIQRIVQTRQC